MNDAAVTGANALGATVLVVTAVWFPYIDRLDITKLLVLATAALVLAAWRLATGAGVSVPLGAALLLSAALGTLLPAARAAHEAWLVPWLAVFIWWLVGPVDGARLVRWLCAVAMVQALLVLQGVLGDPLGLAEEVAFRGRIGVGTFGNPTVLGVWISALVPLAFALPKPWPIPAALSIGGAALATQSRTAMGLLVLGVLGMVVVVRPAVTGRGLARWLLVVVIGGAAAGGLLLRGAFVVDPWVERLEVVRATVAGFLATGAWWKGLGPEAFAHHWHVWREAHRGPPELHLLHVHLDPLEWWVELGLAGLLLWAVPLGTVWARRRCFHVREGLAAVAMVLLFVASLLQPTLVLAPGALLAASLASLAIPRRAATGGRLVLAATAVFIAVAWFYVALRFSSEWIRADATRARLAGRASLERALAAAERDPTNDRAWLEVMMAEGADRSIQRAAARKLRVRGLTPPAR